MTHQELLHKFADRSITPKEKQDFWQSLDDLSMEQQVEMVMQHERIMEADTDWQPSTNELPDGLLQRIRSWEREPVAPTAHRIHFLKTAWFRYAALLLLIAGTATYLYIRYEGPPKEIVYNQPTTETRDIQPGGNKAILTLSDGSTIVLDSAANGALASQGNTKIIKVSEGALAYQGTGASEATGFNTISTPNGGQYQVVLPDGTKVWLNAASSIRFPTAFTKDRQVTVTGEVYMEVASLKNQPFWAHTNTMDVQVLGTRFNVNAYAEEAATRTTLLQGKVRVQASGAAALVLEPGQQAVTAGNSLSITVHKGIDTGQVTAWKNGLFSFDNTDVKTVMRQLSRWYDIEVQYAGAVPARTFSGEIGRSLTLQQVLSLLGEARINYQLEHKKLTILP